MKSNHYNQSARKCGAMSKNFENNQTIMPDKLKAANKRDLYGKAVDFSKYTFWQYTNVETICKVLGGNVFWVNNISTMNDLREADLHGAEKKNIFIQCFVNSNTEKIPMWYLYGGIVGRGASIGFTPGVMLNYINSIKYVKELVEEPGKGFRTGKEYMIGKDFELQYGWVFYADDKYIDDASASDNRTIRVNYFNTFLNVPNAKEFYKDNYFVKDFPWEYEKEFRLVFINKTGKDIKKIQIDIPEEFRTKNNRKLKVRLAPEVKSDEEFERYKKKILKAGEDYKVTVLKSELKINMDLLGRNKNDINEHVQLEPDFLTENVQKRVCINYLKQKKLMRRSVKAAVIVDKKS